MTGVESSTSDGPGSNHQSNDELEQRRGHPILTPRDCAICFVPVEFSPFSSLTLGTERRNYMVTPCGHLYHTDCLLRWMDVKMECPACRAPLPVP